MKRALYSLADEEFAFLVDRVGEELRKREIPHIFVGGTAIQAHLLDRFVEKYGLDIASLASGEQLRLQDYLRCTDDVDLALQFARDATDEKEVARRITDLCSAVGGEILSKTENNIFEYGIERKGIKRPIFSVSVDGERKERIALNISRKSSDLRNLESRFYNEFIENGQELTVPYAPGFNLRVRVPKPEHVLATKISHFRAKDTMDMQNLVALMRATGEEVDLEEIKRILLPEHTRKYEKFLSLIEGNH